jgi:hypothetical protein
VTSAGPDLVLETAGCGPLLGDDVAEAIGTVEYDAGTRCAAVRLATGTSLPVGLYGAAACAALTDEAGNALDGDGDGTGGDDFVRLFGVEVTNLLANPNFDADLAGWTLTPAEAPELGWSLADAEAKPTSGAARMSTTSSHAGTWTFSQCLPVSAGSLYRAALATHVTGAGSGGPDPEVRLGLEGFTGASCDGTSTATRTATVSVADTPGWVSGELRGWRPSEALVAASARVQAEVLGFGIYPSYTIDLDLPLFALDVDLLDDGFESGDLDAWGGATP